MFFLAAIVPSFDVLAPCNMYFCYVSYYAVLEVGDGVFEVLSTSGDTHLGGDDFDKVSQTHILIL